MVDEDPRLAQYAAERAELEKAVVKAMQGQYIGRPPPLLTGWAERLVAAVVCAGWLPPAGVDEVVRETYQRGQRDGFRRCAMRHAPPF